MAPTPQENNVKLSEQILQLRQKIVALETQEGELTAAQSKELTDIETKLSKILKIQEKRIKAAQGIATSEAEIKSSISSQISEVASLSSIYTTLKQTNIANLRTAQQSLATVQQGLLKDENKKAILESTLDGVSKLQEIQKQIAESGSDEVEKQEALRETYKFQESLLRDTLSAKQKLGELTKEEFDTLQKILDSQKDGLEVAEKFGTINSETKEIIQGQLDAYKAVGKTIRGVVGTAAVLMSTPGGILGATLIGAGKLVGKLGEVNKELGTTFSDMNIQGGLTALIFDDYVDNVKALNKELGSASESQGSLARNMSEIALTFGTTGPEAAALVGSFSRLNGNSEAVALDMMATSREFARQNNLIPGALMSDIAGSAEAFALYGKDGGKNILEAAGYAQKLGVEMSTIEKITDSLLDFETSITKELELGAMLGRNINLDRARALAYEDDMAGAVRATLDELGGIDEFNKMDRYAKRQTADLLGLTVQEFQKINALQAQGNDLSKITMENFDEIETASEGFANIFGGRVLEFLGAAAIAAGQLGGQLIVNNRLIKAFTAQQQMSSPPVPTPAGGGLTQGVDKRGRSFTRGANGRFTKAPTTPVTPQKSIATNVNKTAGGAGGINMKTVLQGAAAILILAGAMFVFAKAAQEFGSVDFTKVFIGIGAMATLGVVAGVLGIGPIAAAVGIGTGLILGLSTAFLIFSAGALIMATAVTMIANALPLLANGISSLVPMIGGIFGLAGAFTALGFSLAVLGSMGLIALPVLLGIGAAAAGLGLLFGALGVGDSTSGIEGGSLSEYESTMLNKMDSLIQAVSSNKDVYLDKDKVTSLVMQKSDRSIVNKLNIFNA